MKKFAAILAVIFLGTFWVAGNAMATGFDFTGSFTFTDEDKNNFAETLDLNTSIDGISRIINFYPPDDTATTSDDNNTSIDENAYALFVYGDYAGFQLDENDYSSEKMDDGTTVHRYGFNPDNFSAYSFNVYSTSGLLLVKAGLRLNPIYVYYHSDGQVTGELLINLSEIELLTSDPDIVAAFQNIDTVKLTFDAKNANLFNIINSAGGSGSYSGSAYPVAEPISKLASYSTTVATVPEPATMLLLGISLLCLFAVGRRKIVKN